MSKNGKRELYIGAMVQIVAGESVVAGVVTNVPASDVVNVKTFDDGGGSAWLTFIQSEEQVKATQKTGVGFMPDRFWRWPR